MSLEKELDIYLRARFTLMVLVTAEEERALQTVKAVCERANRICLTWDMAEGFQSLAGSGALPSARDALTALEQVDKTDGDALFVLKDFHECWTNAQFKRKLRSLAQRLKFTRKSILITAPSSKIPEELKDEAVIVEFPPPDASQLEAVLDRLTQTPGVKINLTRLGREKLVQAALGLTASQAHRVFAKAIVSTGTLDDRDIDLVTQEKKEIIRESEALEFYAVTETADDVGGLGVLKDWLRLRERAFTKEARDYGLPSPKGIAMIGIPGCVRGDTRVLLADGRMPTIESLARNCSETLETGIYPLALDVVGADGQPERATELHIYADQPTLIIQLAAGHEIEVTREHPLLTGRGWVPAADLREGDKVVLHFGHPMERWQPKLTEFSNFTPVLRKCPVEVTLPEILEADLAGLLGALSAEGSVEYGRVAFTIHSAEKDFAAWIEETCEKVFAIRPIRQRIRSGKQIQCLRLSSVLIAANLKPFLAWSRLRRVPDMIFRTAHDHEVAAYLRGLFEGDGSIYLGERKKEVSLKTASAGLARDAQLLLARLGIPALLYQDKRTGCWVVSIKSRSSIEAYARQIGFLSAGKQQRLKTVLTSYQRNTNPHDKSHSAVVSLRASWQARVFDLHVPEGNAFVANGIINHNTGKSLTAKMIGGLWRLPLLRLDVGALFGSLVGEAEERTRRALRMAETVAPAIIWIDEMEKALAHGGGDSGTSTRVFGAILTWMQEKTAPCFVVGTANDIASLPPEVLRKGRFDEIFFLDLPTLEERREIFMVHLRKRNRLPQDFDTERLAREAEGYVGAEIEQAVIDAMYVGFNAGREFTAEDISAALRRQVPLSVSQRETIGALRNWLREGRAQSASFQEIREAEQQFVPLQVEPNR